MKVPILELKPAYDEVSAECDAAYRRVMESGRYLLGKELEGFENEYSRSIGAAHCVGVANGLEALQLVLMAWGVGPGDEVIVPAHGYIATWLAVSQVGASVVPCECDEGTYNLDPEQLGQAISKKTKVILPIHLYGLPADMDGINALAKPTAIKVLEDAAQLPRSDLQRKTDGKLGRRRRDKFLPEQESGRHGGCWGCDDQRSSIGGQNKDAAKLRLKGTLL